MYTQKQCVYTKSRRRSCEAGPRNVGEKTQKTKYARAGHTQDTLKLTWSGRRRSPHAKKCQYNGHASALPGGRDVASSGGRFKIEDFGMRPRCAAHLPLFLTSSVYASQRLVHAFRISCVRSDIRRLGCKSCVRRPDPACDPVYGVHRGSGGDPVYAGRRHKSATNT